MLNSFGQQAASSPLGSLSLSSNGGVSHSNNIDGHNNGIATILNNPFNDPRMISPPRHRSPHPHAAALSPHVATPTRSAAMNGWDQGLADGDAQVDAMSNLLCGSEDDIKRLSLDGRAESAQHTSPSRAHLHNPSSHSSIPQPFIPVPPVPSAPNGFISAHSPLSSPSLPPAPTSFYYDLLKCAREGDCVGLDARLERLRTSGAHCLDIDWSDSDGDTALHRAAAGGQTEMVQMLVLKYGADLMRTNQSGDSPLLTNLKSHHVQPTLIQFLITCGADMHATNKMGVSAWSLAASSSSSASSSTSAHPSAFPPSPSAFNLPSHANAANSPSSTLQSLMSAAHSSPVRSFILLQRASFNSLRNSYEESEKKRLECEKREMERVHALESALHSTRRALQSGLERLDAMFAELDRLRSQQAPAATDGAHNHQAQVYISEVCEALKAVRQGFV